MRLKTFILLIIIVIIFFQALEKEHRGLTYTGASPYNSNWDGTALLLKVYRESYGNVIVIDNWLSLYLGRHNKDSCNVLLIVSPEKRYTLLEKFIIYKLVYEEGYTIIIFDEGPYSNELLSYLNVPVFVSGYNYIKSVSGSPIVQGKVLLNNTTISLLFAYVSPITIYDENACRAIAFIKDTVVGATCNIGGKRFLVIGDGSIVTNSVLIHESILNPYVVLSKYVVLSICNSSNSITVYIDSTKYRMRLATIEELMELGYSPETILSILINPSRYISILLLYIDESSADTFILYFTVLAFVLTTILANRILFRDKSRLYSQSKLLEGHTYRNMNRKNMDDIIRIACDIIKEFKENRKYKTKCKCEFKGFRKDVYLKELKSLIDNDKELRKRILYAM